MATVPSSNKKPRKIRLVFSKNKNKNKNKNLNPRKRKHIENEEENERSLVPSPKRQKIALITNKKKNEKKQRKIKIKKKMIRIPAIEIERNKLKSTFIRYHNEFRVKSDWLESVEINDFIEWKNENDQYIFVKILNRGYKAKIKYFINNNKYYKWINIGNTLFKNKGDLKYKIRPKQGIHENPQQNPFISSVSSISSQIESNDNDGIFRNAFDQSSANLSSLWFQNGKEIEIYLNQYKQWINSKIVKINSFFEFEYDELNYAENKKIIKYGQSIINNKNFRLPLQCIPTKKWMDQSDNNDDIGIDIRIIYNNQWSPALFYGKIKNKYDKIHCFYPNDKLFKIIKFTSKDCLFYFPIQNIDAIKQWISERPVCDCTTAMNQKLITSNKKKIYCYQCHTKFICNDSLWFCPKQNIIKFHIKDFYLCSRCVINRPCILINIDEDNNNSKNNKKNNKDSKRCKYRFQKLIGKTKKYHSLQSPKILKILLNSYYHHLLYYAFDDDELIELLDEEYLNIDNDNDNGNKCIIPFELRKLAKDYLEKSNLKALYYIYKVADYRYYQLNYSLNQSRYIPPLLKNDEITIEDTDSDDELILDNNNKNNNKNKKPISIKQEIDIDQYISNEEKDDEDEVSDNEPIMNTVKLPTVNSKQFTSTNVDNNAMLTMPALEEEVQFDQENWSTDDAFDRYNDNDVTPEPLQNHTDDEHEDNDNDDDNDDNNKDSKVKKEEDRIKNEKYKAELSPSPPPELRVVPYDIPGPPQFIDLTLDVDDDCNYFNNLNANLNHVFNDEISKLCKESQYKILSIEKKKENDDDDDDIEIINPVSEENKKEAKEQKEKEEKKEDILCADIAIYTSQIETDDVMEGNIICIGNNNMNNNRIRFNLLRERGVNPWMPNDFCRVYFESLNIWLYGKIIDKIWNPKAKFVFVHHYSMPWMIDKRYEIFSLNLQPVFDKNVLNNNNGHDNNNNNNKKKKTRLLLIDRLENGTPIKIWGPPWRYGRILWKWNDNDLVCIQFNGQNIENCKTYHAHNKRWKLTILSNEKSNSNGCRPPPMLKMAKQTDITFSNNINLISSDSENDLILLPSSKEKKDDNDNDILIKKEEDIIKEETKKKKKKKKIKNESDNDSDYLYDEAANIDNVDNAEKFKKLQDGFMDYIINEDDDDIDKRGIIIESKVDEEINKKYELIEKINDDKNLINYNEKEYDENGQRRFYRTRNRINKINHIRKIKKYKLLSDDENDENYYNILVYGIEEGSCFYPQQNILILWKFMNENHCNLTLEFEINLMHKQYLNVIPKGKKKKKLSIYWDRISLLKYNVDINVTSNNSIWLKCNKNGEYIYNTLLPKDIPCNQDIYKINICLKADKQCQGNSFEFEVRSIMCCANLQQQFLSTLNNNKDHYILDNINNINYDNNEYNIRNKDYSNDNGVWCPCGSTSITRYDYECDDNIEWIQCDQCKTWQHINCILLNKSNYFKLKELKKYLCPWCNNTSNGFSIGELKPLFAKFMKTIWMLNESCSYKRKHGIIYGNDQDIINNLNKRSIYNLKQLALGRGLLPSTNINNKKELISLLTESTVFARTPNNLGQYIATLVYKHDRMNVNNLRIADLMAGNGNITQWLPGYHILAVEKNKLRYESGKRCCQRATWLNCDIFSQYFIKNYVFKCKPFDIVISNPDFEYGFAAIYVGLLMIRGNPKSKLIYLLPMDFFNGTEIRRRLYKICNFHIECVHSVGRWNYYKDRYFKSFPKIHCDGIFIIKPGKYSKYSYIMKQPLISKELINYQT